MQLGRPTVLVTDFVSPTSRLHEARLSSSHAPPGAPGKETLDIPGRLALNE